MIHVCFALYDPARHYSKFTGTAMLSLFENTSSKVTVHLLYDNTLTEDNREKFIQIAENYGQTLKLYNVEELCTEEIEKIKEFFPNVGTDRHSIATFYRFFIPHILPQDVEKLLYLDSDIIVNLDIEEFWQIELDDKPFGAVPEFYQVSDEQASINRLKRYIPICGAGVVNLQDYFNAGVMLINLKVLREEEDTILAGTKFISEHPQYEFLDQDILNYCFSTTYLKLPSKFNRFVLFAKREEEWAIQEKVYHYASNRLCFVMDSRDLFNQLFMNYFIKTPWVDDDMKVALSGGIPSRKNYFVSVIIPMYNAEEFIGECLNSLLVQTFQDFEVIVVDDCSTDDSVEIVKSYAPNFNGRLQIAHTEKNSGGGGNVPRNIGLGLSCGEYVYILDADDMILSNTFETFFAAAILYDAEVVYTASWYQMQATNDIYLARDAESRKMPGIQTKLTIDDPNANLTRLLLEGNREIFADPWSELISPGNNQGAWTKFVRRDFLIKNKIFFPDITTSGDFIWVINLYCRTRRFLKIATPFYLHRAYNDNSITRKIRPPREQCWYWFSAFVELTKALHELKKKNEILAENTILNLAMLRGKFAWHLNRTDYARKELDNEEFFKVLYNEFAKNSSDSSALLLPFLFSFVNSETKSNEYYSKIIDKFNFYFTMRIDVRFVSSEGDFQIVSVSDDNANISRPAWLQKNGVGYQVQSCTGDIKIIFKATAIGEINLSLRSIDIRDSEDKAKRIPYWIDYTKLIVNGKTVFDTVTSAWHDKSFNYNLDVKADEEIVVEVEWLPHRSDTVAIAAPAPEKVAETKKLNAAIESLSTKTTELQRDNADLTQTVESLSTKTAELQDNNAKLAQTVENLSKQTTELQRNNSDLAQIINKFAPYFTARIDVKLVTSTGDFQILSLSDESAEVSKPAWFNKDGIGYAITSHVGNLKITAKATADGQIQLYLRSRDVRDPEDRSKHIPQWIDYTELTVNGLTILNELTPAWHDKPYRYNVEVKADEEINIEVDWLPHTSEA